MEQELKHKITREYIELSKLHPNTGQLDGLPKNPRYIDHPSFKKLIQSIKDDPEMLEIREIVVYDTEDERGYVIIGGNMRYEALLQLKYEESPCKVIHPGFPMEKIRRIVLKDNSSFGDFNFDALLAEWEIEEINAANIKVPDIPTPEQEEEAQDDAYDVAGNTPKKATSKMGDLYQLGRHRLICGDSTKPEYLEALMDGEPADLLVTDPPYNVDYSAKGKMKIANDNMADENFVAFLTDTFRNADSFMKPGAAFYIWHADSQGLNFRNASRNIGWTVRQCLIWNKNSLVLGRQDYQWKHEPCQPAGTMILTTDGIKPIESLRDGDKVVSFDTFSGQVKGYRNGGYEVKTASRDYEGLLYSIKADGKTTRATDNHQFSCRFNAESKRKYCTYLMQRGDWWRVGIAKGYDARQFGMKTRYHQEKAERMWLLDIHEDKIAAQVQEQIIAVKYGIPYTIWENDRFQDAQRTSEHVALIYSSIDLDKLSENAIRCLHEFNRSERFPLIDETSKKEKFSTRVTAKIHACNLVPELMQVPVPTGGNTFKWASIDSVTAKIYHGVVYSLSVEKYQHYISDGIITHNCLYGWKEGAAHYFVDKRNLTTIIERLKDLDSMTKKEMLEILKQLLGGDVPTTVIDCPKPAKNPDHPTMKPVPLIGKLISNSSRMGELVLDIFGGSGTTLIACEQLNRSCRMVEFEPVYVDVIIKRWEELSGEKARLIRNIHEGKEGDDAKG